eukprot:365192-Chlamydomonas_euryale.AAC.27
MLTGGVGSNSLIGGVNSSLTCLYDNITTERQCPEDNPAVFFLKTALNTMDNYEPFSEELRYT